MTSEPLLPEVRYNTRDTVSKPRLLKAHLAWYIRYMASPALPSYQTAAATLEGDKGSGIRLFGWTIARTLLIAPAMQIVGVPARQAWIGAGLASGVMSVFVLLRIFDARHTGLAGLKRPLCKPPIRRSRR